MQYHAMPCHAMSCIIVGHLSINIPPSTEQTRNAVPPSRVTALYFCTVPKNTQKYQKLPPKVTVSTPNCQCPGTNQKYCASQQGDCKHIGYCDPNATCKKKANVSFRDIAMLSILLDYKNVPVHCAGPLIRDILKLSSHPGWQVWTVLAVRMQQGMVW